MGKCSFEQSTRSGPQVSKVTLNIEALTSPVEGVRMDWPLRTNWESTIQRERERVMRWWRFGEKIGNKENINDLTEAHMDFCSISTEPNYSSTGVDRTGEKKCLLILPREINTYAWKASLTVNFFACSLFSRMHLFFVSSCLQWKQHKTLIENDEYHINDKKLGHTTQWMSNTKENWWISVIITEVLHLTICIIPIIAQWQSSFLIWFVLTVNTISINKGISHWASRWVNVCI